ncbi:hypothetical protein PsAD46_01760 [Pseudovibrio sp. Ad46]|uniref:DUF1499 domain-containing protein n=1 Tax=unclassified Pseudovibrio TaxID=2627060 RepID=UPI0007AEC8E7|nr:MULTISPECIES: DUF1499 domain-containing protein [unclassified Pseudovibrio]KZK90236.1 hypothetical protein PsAD5_04670 [Pseudovibrio sp. Ad5]KZK91535.1 hypothetical protein PsAD46_01760 [Pseudovibrio sp. Ad46]
MTLQLPSRHSRTALRSRRIGAIAIPFLILSVAGHYFELFNTEVLLVLFVIGFFMGAAAIVLAAMAVVDLWNNGGKGFGNSFLGTFYGAIVLAPLFIATLGLYLFPPLNDVSTDMDEPPALIAGDRIDDEIEQDKQLMQKASYPDIVPRRFRLPPPELHNAVSSVASSMGWKVIYELPAGFPDEPTYLLMEARMPYFSLKDDVAIRIQPDRVGTLLDIRSASRFGSHDFGTNARRIRGFLASLDKVLLQNYGITARVEEPELVLQDEAEEPPRIKISERVPLLEAPLELPPSIASMLKERGTAPIPSQKPAQ